MKRKTSLIIAGALTISILIADIHFPLGYAVWLLYVIQILIAAPYLSRFSLLLFPLMDTLLLVAGFFLSPENGHEDRAVISRAAGAFTLWVMTVLIDRRRQADEALERYYRELEQRVHERTAQLNRTNASLQNEILVRKNMEDVLARSRAEFQSILNSMADAVIFADTNRRILLVNPAFTAQFGYTFEEVRGKTTEFLYLDQADFADQGMKRYHMGEEAESQAFTVQYRRKDGTHFWSETLGMQVRNENGNILGYAAICRDITERRKMEEEIKSMAHHDPLTGLPNRRFFADISHIELAEARRNNRKAAVLFLDLDRFKEINDVLGHETGDALLTEVALRLRAQVRATDTVARIGGDEFNILLADLIKGEDSVLIARKILDALGKPYAVAGHELRTSASIGISLYPDDAGDLETLLRYADIALYYAKEQGRNNFQFYNPAINARSAGRIRLESSLQQTLERGELEVRYQPQVDMKTGKIVNGEALVRWRHPELGLLEPKRFLPAAEETGFITAMDTWVLRTACSQIKSWLDAGLDPGGVTVNVSARHFQNPELVWKISDILRDTGLPAAYLNVEITETTAMSNVERTVVRLNELLELGVHVSLDDFGTGYSSLNYLKRLPIRRLKIDRSFIRDIATDEDDRAIIRAVTAMAHMMSIRVLALGVEADDQMAFLRSAGCDEMQGFAASGPLPAREFRELLVRAG